MFPTQVANEAIVQWPANLGTWSTHGPDYEDAMANELRRRSSEPSLADFEAVVDGRFLKKLSISPRKEEKRQSGLTRLFTRKETKKHV